MTKREIQKRNHPKPGSQIKVDPIRDLKAIKNIKRLLSDNPMNLALFTIGINTNLRASDILNLKVGQVRDSTEIEIREQKTKKLRRVTLNKSCADAIRNLLDTREYDDNDFLFKSQRGRKDRAGDMVKKWTVPYVSAKVKKWCSDLNLKGNYGSHTLRKTWGYHQRVTFKIELPILMRCFNHSNQRQTLDYLCIQEQEIEDVFQNEL